MTRQVAATLALALTVLALGSLPAAAQLAENLGALSDVNAKQYLGPLPDALAGTMNSAIFTTGKVPKTGINFSIGLKVMGINFDSNDRSFTPTDPPGFTSIGPPQQAPTVIGSTAAVTQNGQGGATLYYPGGFDITEFAFAAPQVSIGSVLGTRAVGRWYSQTFGAHDLIKKVSYYGVGAQHSITQYFTTLPVDIAVGAFYQQLKFNDHLMDIKTVHGDVTVSKSFTILQPYGAIGFDTFKMDVSYEDATNPGNNVAVAFDQTSHIRLTAGVVATLAIVTIHAEASHAATNGVAVGLSLGH